MFNFFHYERRCIFCLLCGAHFIDSEVVIVRKHCSKLNQIDQTWLASRSLKAHESLQSLFTLVSPDTFCPLITVLSGWAWGTDWPCFAYELRWYQKETIRVD